MPAHTGQAVTAIAFYCKRQEKCHKTGLEKTQDDNTGNTGNATIWQQIAKFVKDGCFRETGQCWKQSQYAVASFVVYGNYLNQIYFMEIHL